MSLQRYRDLAKEAESSVAYWTDVAVNDFARELHELMKRRNVSNAELARRLGVERQYISKLLGGANVTLQTMVKLAMALGGVVRVRLEEREDRKIDAGVVVEFAPGEPLPAEPEAEPRPKRRRG
jgi:transcriptional regulator with XRE-family HTH domain